MAEVPILVCDCGKKLRAPGARPGRVGRCPACGGELRVPETSSPDPRLRQVNPPEPPASNPDFDDAPTQAKPKRRRKPGPETEIWNGLIKPPSQPETTLRATLSYPFWGATGVVLLVIFPPILWIASVMVTLMGTGFIAGTSLVKLVSLISLIPIGLGSAALVAFLLLYFGRVLASSAIGEVHHPRWPDWELTALSFGIGRWIVALLVGGVVGGFPAVAYWIYAGDIDFFDAMILSELAAVGAIYALMALLASILHDDPWGANPITVLSAIRKVGWGYAEPCLVTGVATVLAGTVLGLTLKVDSPALSAFLFYVFWVFALYEAMVVLRVLGLFYRRHAKALGWFRGRTGWTS